jgi:Zn finger protein HypA/HybF involved in hydrogenase expression
MGKKKTSIVWSVPCNEFERLVKDNDTLAGILRELPLPSKGGNINTLKRRIKEEGIDISHIALGNDSNKGKKIPREPIPLEKVMTKDSTYSRSCLKKRLLKQKLLKEECYICEMPPVWHNTNLVLVLDHINGVSDDHRLENLRLLCPNCNSQQSTFAGKRLKIMIPCKECEEQIYKNGHLSGLCQECSKKRRNSKGKIERPNRRKVERPSKEQILQEIAELGYCGTGRKYGVTDNAVRKWIN